MEVTDSWLVRLAGRPPNVEIGEVEEGVCWLGDWNAYLGHPWAEPDDVQQADDRGVRVKAMLEESEMAVLNGMTYTWRRG